MDNEEKKKIQESTDPSMDEMGTWYLPGYGPGMIRKATRREYLLSGETGSWISDKEIESKEEKERKEAKAREERKKEIKESTDPSMDEIVNYSWDGHPRTDFGGVQKYSIVVTKREKLLIDLKELNPYEIWKKQEDERGEEYKKQRQKERQEILNSTDPSMDEKITFWHSDSICRFPVGEVTMTKRQKMLYDRYLLTDEEYEMLVGKTKIEEPTEEKKVKYHLKKLNKQ